MKIVLITIALLFSLFTTNAEELDTTVWELRHEKEGIFIYTKIDPHQSIKDLKMTSTISGKSLSSFVALFQDLAAYPTWVYSCNEAEIIEEISDKHLIYYMYSDFPWPMSDRDFVLHNRIWYNAETGSFHSKSDAHNNLIDEKEGVVRVTHFTAEWIITPINKEKFDVWYTFSADPAGQIPAWVVNIFSEMGPFKTIKQMEIEAKKPKYADVEIQFLKEKSTKMVLLTE